MQHKTLKLDGSQWWYFLVPVRDFPYREIDICDVVFCWHHEPPKPDSRWRLSLSPKLFSVSSSHIWPVIPRDHDRLLVGVSNFAGLICIERTLLETLRCWNPIHVWSLSSTSPLLSLLIEDRKIVIPISAIPLWARTPNFRTRLLRISCRVSLLQSTVPILSGNYELRFQYARSPCLWKSRWPWFPEDSSGSSSNMGT